MIIIERQFGSTRCNFFNILYQFFHTTNFRKRWSHCSNSCSSDFLRMLRQHTARFDAAAPNVNNYLKSGRRNRYPTLGKFHTLFFSQHISFTGRTINEYSLKAIFLQHFCIGFNRFIVYFSIFIKRSERRINQTNNLFHTFYFLISLMLLLFHIVCLRTKKVKLQSQRYQYYNTEHGKSLSQVSSIGPFS